MAREGGLGIGMPSYVPTSRRFTHAVVPNAIRLDAIGTEGMLSGMTALAVFVGSGLGGLARWLLTAWVSHRAGTTFPWGTLLVNVSGSFLIGVFSGMTSVEERAMVRSHFREFFMIGICGGYTTFSSFSLQTLQLVQQGEALRAGANVGLSVVLCLAAVWLGHWVVETTLGAKGV